MESATDCLWRPQQQHHQQQRSPRAPELHRRPDGDGGQQPQRRPGGPSPGGPSGSLRRPTQRSPRPRTELSENGIGGGGLVAAPAGRAVDLVRASQWIKRRNAPPYQCCFDRGGIEVDPVPRCARPTPPTTPSNPAPRRPHQPQPKLRNWRRRPAGGASESVRLRVARLTNVAGKISQKNCRKRNWRSAAQPARAGRSAGGARRSAPPRARTREIRANKVNAALHHNKMT